MWNPYAAGQKIYNGGSSAATQGTVDPSGYIQRGMNNQFSPQPLGADGMSDQRSGLASAALDRLRNMRANPMTGGVPGPDVQNPPGVPTQTPQPYATIAPMPKTSPTGQILPDPSLQGFMNNLFTAPPPGTSGLNGLGYDPNVFNQAQNLNVSRTNQYADMDNQANNILEDYGVANRKNDRRYVDTQRNTLNNDAGRGMAYSSGHAVDVTRDAQNYADAASQLLRLRNQGLTGLTTQKNAFDLGYSTQIAQLQRALAQISAVPPA